MSQATVQEDASTQLSDELEEALVAYLRQREELRCAELQDNHGLVVACVFSPLLLATIFICGSLVLDFAIAGQFGRCVFPALLILVSILGIYLVKNAYDYGRRSYKVALNLSKDRAEKLARRLPESMIPGLLQAHR